MGRASPKHRIRLGSTLRHLESSVAILAEALSDTEKSPGDRDFYEAETPLAIEAARDALAELSEALLAARPPAD